MSTLLYNSIARIARHEVNRKNIAAIGVVMETFGGDGAQKDHAVSVKLRDTNIMLPKVPIAVNVMGFAALPAVGDLVIILFINGDQNAPVVAGCLYNSDKEPPKHTDGEINLKLPAGSDEGDLNLTIKGEEPSLKLTLPAEVEISAIEGALNFKVGKISVGLTASGGGLAEIAAGGSTITIKQDGDIIISAQGKLNLEGQEVSIKGQAGVLINGAKVEVN